MLMFFTGLNFVQQIYLFQNTGATKSMRGRGKPMEENKMLNGAKAINSPELRRYTHPMQRGQP